MMRAAIGSFVFLLTTHAGSAQQPQRDAAPATTGSAIVTGVVVSDAPTALPIGRAVVTISGAALAIPRTAVTDGDGRFEIRDLPAGLVEVSAGRHGYVTTQYGALRPGRPGTPVPLVDGRTHDLTIRLGRAAVVAGTIRDSRGEPIPDLLVFALNLRDPNATMAPAFGRRTTPTATTDDGGTYRMFDLTPGEYVIAALSTKGDGRRGVERPSAADNDRALARLRGRGAATPARSGDPVSTSPGRLLAFVPVFFPGTAKSSDASRVVLRPGEERSGLDFAFEPTSIVTVEGTLVSASGPLPAGIELTFQEIDAVGGTPFYATRPVLTGRPDATGRFRYSNVVPGRYLVAARASGSVSPPGRGGEPPAPRSSDEVLYGLTEVDVGRDDVSGVTVTLRPGVFVTGRLMLDRTSADSPPLELTQIRIGVTSTRSGVSWIVGTPLRPIAPRPDGTFDIGPLAPGTYRIQSSAPVPASARWWLRSATHNGRDVLDAELDVPPDARRLSLELTMTDRMSEVAGRLEAPSGAPASEYEIVMFPVDQALWAKASRRLRATRPAADGTFRFAQLPGGEYFLAALTAEAPDDWRLPSFLRDAAAHAVRIVVNEGRTTIQDLRIARRATAEADTAAVAASRTRPMAMAASVGRDGHGCVRVRRNAPAPAASSHCRRPLVR